jgi:NIMA (never in mitosis gene a)-related kinase
MAEHEVWSLFVQMVKGLHSLHELKIVHRDLKPANLFLTASGGLKLGDLNVSKVSKGGMLQTQTGTPYYCSPEVWQNRKYDSQSDIWSLGCVLFEICELRPPFQATSMEQLCRRCCSGTIPIIGKTYSKDLNSIVRICL